MKRVLAAAIVTISTLAGCGTDTCSSNPAQLADSVGTSCTLAAGTSATIVVPLCSRCNDSSPACQGEFVGDHFEIAPVVQQCQGQSGCASSGCNAAAQSASCGVAVPASLSGSYPLYVIGESTVSGTVYIGSGTTCRL